MPADRAAIHGQLAVIFEGLSLDMPPGGLDLFETGVLDSLAFVQLLLRLEEQMGVTVSLDDLEIDHFRTIEHIIDFVTSHRQQHVAV
jgi:methoxymalonate biosynthesis acyl carrier protein